MFDIISLSLLALSLFPISRASFSSTILDSDTDPPALVIPPTNVIGPVSRLLIANHDAAPDGYSRAATLVNGMNPAPLIRARKNDQFSLQLVNQLTDDTMPFETSIHWHGMNQRKSSWADGVAYITQCPLRPGEVFTARFTAPDQTGTYWYHSHYSTQYCDGLRGPMVIYDPEDPLAYLYDVDDENTVITLVDWYHNTSLALNNRLGRVTPDSTLINGRGRYTGGPLVPLSVINVRQGLRYRFRLIGMSCEPSFNFTIDGHRMTIIEVDGTEVKPVEVDSIPVLPGQRYSVVVTAGQPVGNYWIRAAPNYDPTFGGGQNLAILRYEGAPDQDPTSAPGPYELSFDEGQLHPLFDARAPGIPEIDKADISIQLQAGIRNGSFEFNNVTFENPDNTVLLQILSGAKHPAELLPNGTIFILPPHKVIELSFPNPLAAPGGPHPIHLHGHAFSVVRVAGSNVTNFVNPVIRDVVSMGESTTDNVTIRFVTDNPGPWILHCHIDWHLFHGLAALFAEAPRLAAHEAEGEIPADWFEMCRPGRPWGQTYLGMIGHE